MIDQHKAELIAQWVEATDGAISTLIDWRARLTAWGNGGPSSRDDLDQAFDLLTSAGLGEWAEWAPAAGGLDALADALGDPST